MFIKLIATIELTFIALTARLFIYSVLYITE